MYGMNGQDKLKPSYVIGVIFQSYMVTSQKYFGSCKHLFDMVSLDTGAGKHTTLSLDPIIFPILNDWFKLSNQKKSKPTDLDFDHKLSVFFKPQCFEDNAP